MTEELKKDEFTSTMDNAIYTIYDCVLKQYDAPFSLPESKLTDYLTILVNDVQSKYYNHECDYVVNKIGEFNKDTGLIYAHSIKRISVLDKYIDDKKRQIQTIMQTLNYLPTGYFKMPDEMKKDIQEQINNAVSEYVNDYVIPDLEQQNPTLQTDRLSN